MNYKTIYDVSNEGVSYNWLLPLFFVVIGVLFLFFNRSNKTYSSFGEFGQLTNNMSKRIGRVLLPIFIGLSALAFVILLFVGIKNDSNTTAILKSKQYLLVEGKVENYRRWSPRGIQVKETFTINDLEFNFDETDATHKGYRPNHQFQIIHNGSYLRISYYTSGTKKIVLKIEKSIK